MGIAVGSATRQTEKLYVSVCGLGAKYNVGANTSMEYMPERGAANSRTGPAEKGGASHGCNRATPLGSRKINRNVAEGVPPKKMRWPAVRFNAYSSRAPGTSMVPAPVAANV